MVISSVKAQCRVCGSLAPAEEFKLHYKFKQAVCAKCYSGRTEQEKQKAELKKKEEAPKPAGWDEVDDYLSRSSKQKQEEQQIQFSKIPGTSSVKCLCFQCKYSFKYDPERRLPQACPYCNAEVPKFRSFNMM